MNAKVERLIEEERNKLIQEQTLLTRQLEIIGNNLALIQRICREPAPAQSGWDKDRDNPFQGGGEQGRGT